MTVIARKYNPGFLTDDELVASFCVRTAEFESIVETLRECTGGSNKHQIVIGPRGSGKTSLLLRIAVEIDRNKSLSSRFFPIVFSEESYEVSTVGEFWLECLSRLADQVPQRAEVPDLHRTLSELRQIRDDRVLGERCLGTLQDFSDRVGKRLVLMVENLNMMLGDVSDRDAGWQLRQTLQTEPRIVLIASATSRFQEIENPKCALYDFFRTLTLLPLGTEESAVLWQSVSGRPRPPKTISALRILTGGSPRLLTIVARFGARLSFHELMADLLNLVDDHTEYFRSHLDALPPQERRVYLALAELWKPVTAREIAERSRLDTSKCSAQLARLVDRGAVEVTGGSARRKLYYLAERLYNIYYLLRRSRGPAPLIEALIRFMEGYYTTEELKAFGVRIVRETMALDDEAQTVYRKAFARLLEIPSLKPHREELLSHTPWTGEDLSSDSPISSGSSVGAKETFDRALALAVKGRLAEAQAIWAEVVRELGSSDEPGDCRAVATTLLNQGTALGKLGRSEEALASWDEVLRRYASGHAQTLRSAATRALVKKAVMLSTLDRPREALAACDELSDRFKGIDSPDVVLALATGKALRGHLLVGLNRFDDALTAWDEVVQRFGSCGETAILEVVVAALHNKGSLLRNLNRLEEAVEAWTCVVKRFGERGESVIAGPVLTALANTGSALQILERPKEALEAWDEVARRCGKGDSPELLQILAKALVQKGTALLDLNRSDEALAAWDEIILRFGTSDAPEFHTVVANALMNRGALLVGMDRQFEGIAAWDEFVGRFGRSNDARLRDLAGTALWNKGVALAHMNRKADGIAVWEEAIRRVGSGDTEMANVTLALSLVHKGTALAELDRPEESLNDLEEVVQRFGSSDVAVLRDAVSTALLGKSAVLVKLNQMESALEALHMVVKRNREASTTESLDAFSSALLQKGDVLNFLDRHDEARDAWKEVVRHFENSNLPMLRHVAEVALFKVARLELTSGRVVAAIELVNRVLEKDSAGWAETRWQGHMIRAQACLAEADAEACVKDVEAVLAFLPEIGSIPKEVLDGLSELSVDLGLEQMRDLITASPASELLLPMTTALEKELGLKPRVAREVDEVAEDIRRDLEKRRIKRTA